jgi:cytochrome c oxidase assembly factor CtaG
MDPITRAVLRSWELRPEIIILLIVAGAVYFMGWRRLRRRSRRGDGLATRWRLAAYWTGLVIVALALMSPIDVLASQFFFMHMIQHLLLIMAAAPLLMVANPMPFMLWGLPASLRRRVGGWLSRLLHRKSSTRHYLRSVTGSGVVWMVYVFILLGWHDPNAYNAALRVEWVHDLEHFTFFLAAILYWWRITDAAPHIHKRMSRTAQVAYTLAAIPPNMLLGIAISFAEQAIYTYYLGVPRVWGIDVLDDQTLGGVIMWVPGSMMYIVVVLIIASRWLKDEEQKPPLPVADISTEKEMIAPGFERR